MTQTRSLDQGFDTFPLPDELFLTILQLLTDEDLQSLSLIAKDIHHRVQLEQRRRWLQGYQVKDIKGDCSNTFFVTQDGKMLYSGSGQQRTDWLQPSGKLPLPRYTGMDRLLILGQGTFVLGNLGKVYASVRSYQITSPWLRQRYLRDLQAVPIEGQVKNLFPSPGDKSLFYLTDSGSVWAHGFGSQGQLGVNAVHASYPKKLVLDSVLDVFPFEERTFFKCQDGLVYACGDNLCGALALLDGDLQSKEQIKEPVKVSIRDVALVFSKANNTFFLKQDGRVFVCGENKGELGLEFDHPVLEPLELSGLSSIVKIVSSSKKSPVYFIDVYGQVFVIGESKEGQLALGSQLQTKTPQKIEGLWGVESILRDNGWVLFVLRSGKVYGCGALHNLLLYKDVFKEPAFLPHELARLKDLDIIITAHESAPQSDMLRMKDGSVYVLGQNHHDYLGCDGEEFKQMTLVRFPEVEERLNRLSIDELIVLSKQGNAANFVRCIVKSLERVLEQGLRDACCDVLDEVVGRPGVRYSIMRQNPVIYFPGLYAMFGSARLGFRAVTRSEKYAYASLLLALWELTKNNASPVEEAYQRVVKLFNMLIRQEEDHLGLWGEFGFAQDERCQLNTFASVARRMVSEIDLQGIEHLKRSRDDELGSEFRLKRLKLG